LARLSVRPSCQWPCRRSPRVFTYNTLGNAAKLQSCRRCQRPDSPPPPPCLRCSQWDDRQNSHSMLYTDSNEYGEMEGRTVVSQISVIYFGIYFILIVAFTNEHRLIDICLTSLISLCLRYVLEYFEPMRFTFRFHWRVNHG